MDNAADNGADIAGANAGAEESAGSDEVGVAAADRSVWAGRVDGDGPEHARWHQRVRIRGPVDVGGAAAPADVALLGFASDEGVRRNAGRPGAAQAPDALRRALAPLPLCADLEIVDLGTVTQPDDAAAIGAADPSNSSDSSDSSDGSADHASTGMGAPDASGADVLERGQRALGLAVATALDTHRLVVVLGGGHETAFGSYLGWSHSDRCLGARVGVLNLDAHFDLREAPIPTSGTPFLQMARAEQAAGRDLRYAVVGISEASNTRALFDTADALGVRYLLDREASLRHLDRVEQFVEEFVADVDVVHLSIDLDVLPAAQAPGVSAPAAYGVPLETIAHVCRQVAGSGRLALVDVVELCPPLDIDARTARTAARLIHEITSCVPARM